MFQKFVCLIFQWSTVATKQRSNKQTFGLWYDSFIESWREQMDDLTIPDFLLRDPVELVTAYRQARKKRDKKIPYPKDGYVCKGKRQPFRERHKARLRRDAEKMRERG